MAITLPTDGPCFWTVWPGVQVLPTDVSELGSLAHDDVSSLNYSHQMHKKIILWIIDLYWLLIWAMWPMDPLVSLSERKGQVSFSDHNLFVVRHCRRKLFTFFSSSPEPLEPLDQVQTNLAQSIPGWREFMYQDQMNGSVLSKGR